MFLEQFKEQLLFAYQCGRASSVADLDKDWQEGMTTVAFHEFVRVYKAIERFRADDLKGMLAMVDQVESVNLRTIMLMVFLEVALSDKDEGFRGKIAKRLLGEFKKADPESPICSLESEVFDNVGQCFLNGDTCDDVGVMGTAYDLIQSTMMYNSGINFYPDRDCFRLLSEYLDGQVFEYGLTIETLYLQRLWMDLCLDSLLEKNEPEKALQFFMRVKASDARFNQFDERALQQIVEKAIYSKKFSVAEAALSEMKAAELNEELKLAVMFLRNSAEDQLVLTELAELYTEDFYKRYDAVPEAERLKWLLDKARGLGWQDRKRLVGLSSTILAEFEKIKDKGDTSEFVRNAKSSYGSFTPVHPLGLEIVSRMLIMLGEEPNSQPGNPVDGVTRIMERLESLPKDNRKKANQLLKLGMMKLSKIENDNGLRDSYFTEMALTFARRGNQAAVLECIGSLESPRDRKWCLLQSALLFAPTTRSIRADWYLEAQPFYPQFNQSSIF